MTFLNNLFYYGLIIPVSRLPFPLLYGLSDFMYLVIYHGVGYRKKVVLKNIRNSFPTKTETEHREIARKFYRHFCDLTLESLKVFTISEKDIHERMVLKNPDVIDRFFNEGKSVIVAGGHYNNWELFAVAIDSLVKHQTIAIYKPLTSQYLMKR